MSNVKDFLKRKDIVITPQRYLIEALGAMAQGLFASLLIGTIIKTLGQQTGLDVLVDLGGYATAMSGPAMAAALPAAGAVQPDHRRLLGQCSGRRRRPAGRAHHCHRGFRTGQGREQGDPRGHPRDPAGDHFFRRGPFHADRRTHWRCRKSGGHPDHVGH